MGIEHLISLVIYLIIAGLLFWVVWWVLSQLPIPEPFATAIRVIMVVVAALIVIYALLGLLPSGLPRLR